MHIGRIIKPEPDLFPFCCQCFHHVWHRWAWRRGAAGHGRVVLGGPHLPASGPPAVCLSMPSKVLALLPEVLPATRCQIVALASCWVA